MQSQYALTVTSRGHNSQSRGQDGRAAVLMTNQTRSARPAAIDVASKRAGVEDLAALNLLRRLVRGCGEHVPDSGDLLTTSQTELLLEHRATGECIAYIKAELRRFSLAVDPSAPAMTCDVDGRDGELHILDLMVHPEYLRAGCEQILVEQLMIACRAKHPRCRSALMFARRGDAIAKAMACAGRFMVVDCIRGEGKGAPTLLAHRRFL